MKTETESSLIRSVKEHHKNLLRDVEHAQKQLQTFTARIGKMVLNGSSIASIASNGAATATKAYKIGRRRGHKMSKAARKAISIAQRKRWAAKRATA